GGVAENNGSAAPGPVLLARRKAARRAQPGARPARAAPDRAPGEPVFTDPPGATSLHRVRIDPVGVGHAQARPQEPARGLHLVVARDDHALTDPRGLLRARDGEVARI